MTFSSLRNAATELITNALPHTTYAVNPIHNVATSFCVGNLDRLGLDCLELQSSEL